MTPACRSASTLVVFPPLEPDGTRFPGEGGRLSEVVEVVIVSDVELGEVTMLKAFWYRKDCPSSASVRAWPKPQMRRALEIVSDRAGHAYRQRQLEYLVRLHCH